MTPGHLYHLTYHGRLPFIAEEGLRPGAAPSIGGPTYEEHRRGAIFLTGAGGLNFWHERAEEWAHASADDLLEEGFVPVVLRVRPRHCEPDELGSRDSRHPAYRCFETIPPESIELWDASDWIPVEDHESLEPELALDDDGYMLASWENPLLPVPPELRTAHGGRVLAKRKRELLR